MLASYVHRASSSEPAIRPLHSLKKRRRRKFCQERIQVHRQCKSVDKKCMFRVLHRPPRMRASECVHCCHNLSSKGN